jgi:hypothetical protein
MTLLLGGVVSETPLCCLCPVEGGALKRTTTQGIWAHSACCQWIPETTVLDVVRPGIYCPPRQTERCFRVYKEAPGFRPDPVLAASLDPYLLN